MTDPAELDARLHVLQGAGLVEAYVNEDGKDAMRLRPEGERVARQMVMLPKGEQDALLAALVEATAESGWP